MTTTSQQPPAEDPQQGPAARPRRTSLVLVSVIAVVVLVLALLVWLFTAGPLSQAAEREREVQSTLEDLAEASSFAEFNEFLCAEQRVPQDLVDTITASGQQTGTDLDAMFRASIAGSLPEDLTVTDVEVDGETAIATVESGSDGSEREQVRMREEDGSWTVCESEVGMGSVPDSASTGQPG